MVLGKVIGTLVASRKEPTLDGLKLLVVRACDILSAKLAPSDDLDLAAVSVPDNSRPRLRAVRLPANG